MSTQGHNSALSKKSLHKIWQNNSREDKDGGQWKGGGGLLIVCSTGVWEAGAPVHFLPLTNFIFNPDCFVAQLIFNNLNLSVPYNLETPVSRLSAWAGGANDTFCDQVSRMTIDLPKKYVKSQLAPDNRISGPDLNSLSVNCLILTSVSRHNIFLIWLRGRQVDIPDNCRRRGRRRQCKFLWPV